MVYSYHWYFLTVIFEVYLSAGFICLKSDVYYVNLCTEITFSLKPFLPTPTFSIQCNVILLLCPLLLTLMEPKEKEITTVQSSILGRWPQMSWSFTDKLYLKNLNIHTKTLKGKFQMLKLFSNAQCDIY